MNNLHKSLLSLSVVIVSGLKFSNPALAQYVTPLQMFQMGCQQRDQYSCTQYQEMLNRRNQIRRDRDEARRRIDRERRDNSRMNRREACRRSSYDWNDISCDYID